MSIKHKIESMLASIHYRTLVNYIKDIHPQIEYGFADDGSPRIEYSDKQFLGFANTRRETIRYHRIRRWLPKNFPESHYRIVRDLITRYLYPHMMPTIRPPRPNWMLGGFHPQHRDAIPDLKDRRLRLELDRLFTIKQGETIINAGAYIGFGDVRILEEKKVNIIAIEAEKECYDLLNENLKVNNVQQVVALPRAIWSYSGTMELLTQDLQRNSLVGALVDSSEKQNIACVSIDDVVKEQGLTCVDYISLTLNGAELEALDGMRETADRFHPRIRLAGWYARDHQPIWKTAKLKLEAMNYHVCVGKGGNVLAF